MPVERRRIPAYAATNESSSEGLSPLLINGASPTWRPAITCRFTNRRGHSSSDAQPTRKRIRVIFCIASGQTGCHGCAFPSARCRSHRYGRKRRLGLPVDELKESQEICFVSHGDYRTFLESEMPSAKNPGSFVDEQGRE